MILETVMLRCIANCLETSRYYASKCNRPDADWWHGRAEAFAQRLVDAPARKTLSVRSDVTH
jgi:hypothetical protein